MNNSDINVLFNEDELQTRIKQVAKEINELYKGQEIVIVCVLKGAVMFTVDLIKSINIPLTLEFIKLSSYGNSTKSSGEIKILDLNLSNLNNKNVIIVEDIVDTGITAKFIIDFMHKNYELKSLKFVSLLNKTCSRKVNISPDLYCFDVDDKFIVGYGLDDCGYNRNLNYIGYKTI